MSRQIKKAVYRIRNWLDCNRARVKRGLRIPWVDHESLDGWNPLGADLLGGTVQLQRRGRPVLAHSAGHLPLDAAGDNIMTHLGMPVSKGVV